MGSRQFAFRRSFRFMLVLAFGATMPTSAGAVWGVGTPITMYWAGPALTPAVAQQAVDGGFNIVWVRTPEELALAEQYSLRGIYEERTHLIVPATLDDPVRKYKMDTLIDQIKTSPALYSIYVDDEPSATKFAELGRLMSYLRQRAPEHAGYINLHPFGAAEETLGTTGEPTTRYNAYLDQFKSVVQPSLISYDMYQFYKTASGGNYDHPLYLNNLELISRSAHQGGLPFVNIVQGMVYADNWRLPTTSELRFLNYSTLAYGAQGICYFAYDNWGPGKGGIQPNADGTQTSVYTAAASLNPEFIAVAKQYQSLKWIGAYLKGYRADAMPPGTSQLPGNSPFNISAVANTMIYSGIGEPLKGVLFGLFDQDGNTVADATLALVVNLDYSASKNYQVTGPGNLSVFDATTGVWTHTGSASISLDLLPGGGKFIGLTSVISALPVLGDFDADGDVDGADFVVWQTHFPAASGATLATGDADGDGDVDGADFVVWQTHFPTTAGPGVATVPESATWILATVGAAGIGWRPWRRRS